MSINNLDISYVFVEVLVDGLLHGVSSHGKPGEVREFHFFPGLEKSWKLTPGFGKFIKIHGN